MQFPENPFYGQEIKDTTSSGRTWKFDGEKWVLVGAVLTDIEFAADSPVTKSQQSADIGETSVVTYGFDMTKLPRINPN